MTEVDDQRDLLWQPTHAGREIVIAAAQHEDLDLLEDVVEGRHEVAGQVRNLGEGEHLFALVSPAISTVLS